MILKQAGFKDAFTRAFEMGGRAAWYFQIADASNGKKGHVINPPLYIFPVLSCIYIWDKSLRKRSNTTLNFIWLLGVTNEYEHS